MTETDNDSGTKKPAPPRYENILTPAFTAVADKALPLELQTAPFPRSLLPRLQRAWISKPKNRSPYLPTRGLRELVECVGSGVLAVGSDLEADAWLHAVQPPENELPLQLALEAWITTEVAPHQSDVDWFSLTKAAFPLEWTPGTLDLLGHGMAPNGTARPRSHVYQLLPSYLATQWIDNKWTLPGQKQNESAVLGPIGERGERSVYLWPPRELTDDDGAYGLWTHQTKFRVRTMPHDDRLIIRVTPHITRFGGTTPVYIPRRSPEKPPSATVLLYVPGGVLSGLERAQFLRAPVLVTGRADNMSWRWTPGIARMVPSLPTSHLYPDPKTPSGQTSVLTTGLAVTRTARRIPSHFCCTAPATRTSWTNQMPRALLLVGDQPAAGDLALAALCHNHDAAALSRRDAGDRGVEADPVDCRGHLQAHLAAGPGAVAVDDLHAPRGRGRRGGRDRGCRRVGLQGAAVARVLPDQYAATEHGARRDRRDRAQDSSSPQRLPGTFAAGLPFPCLCASRFFVCWVYVHIDQN
ncbi:pPIWI_RE module domain-containing protein [Streptomyces sp. NPDC102437]|uniref:pPIWI_RE module domain-containing protein n=1 Tax=Streptomyces sp. NPDC102437 TaxID=3366175 RepID=UPI00381047AE